MTLGTTPIPALIPTGGGGGVVTPITATATAAAYQPAPLVWFAQPPAPAAAAAYQPTISMVVAPVTAAATATAYTPSFPGTGVPLVAAATAAGVQPVIVLHVTPVTATATATAYAAFPNSTVVVPMVAPATAASSAPVVTVKGIPLTSTAIATAYQPSTSLTVTPVTAAALATALPPTIATGTVIAVPRVAQATATAYQPTVSSPVSVVVLYIFTPPTLREVPTYGTSCESPLAGRLMRFYQPRLRGATVYKMSDGSYRIAREIPGLVGGPPVLDAWPPVPLGPTIDGSPYQVNGVISQTWHYGAIVNTEVQTPAVEIVYYGGHIYSVSATEQADLIAAGLGAYVT